MTIAEDKKRLQLILQTSKLGYWLRGDDLSYVVSLLTLNHPRADEKIGVGIKGIRIATVKPYGKAVRCFELIRIDGTKTDFSYNKIFGSRLDRARLDRYAAFRTAIRKDIKEFKARLFNSHPRPVCPITLVPLTWENSEVDHYPTPFVEVVHSWLEQRGLKLGEIEIIGYADGQTTKRLSDPDLEFNFRMFHRDHASLRLIEYVAHRHGRKS